MTSPRPADLITDATREDFDRDGVVMVPGVFGHEWVEAMREAIATAMANPGPHATDYATGDSAGEDGGKGAGGFFGDVEMALRLPAFERFVRESPAAEIAGRIMGASKVNYFDDHILVKEPGMTKPSPWHQDQPYWAVAGRQVCSLWMPLDPVAEEIAVEFVRGSHKGPAYNPYHFEDGRAYEGVGLPPMPEIDADRASYDIVRYAMEPGDALLFHAMIIHGAPGNTSTNRRRAIATRWTGDDARFHKHDGEISVPTELPPLAVGAILDCERFPVVWRAAGA